jgi:hypothetical protein
VNTNLTLTGTNLGSGNLKWDITDPAIHGQSVFVMISPTKYYQVTANTLTGTWYAGTALLPLPLVDPTNTYSRATSFFASPTQSNLTLTGTANGQPFSLTIKPVFEGGLAGPYTGNYAKDVMWNHGTFLEDQVQGGLPGTLTVDLKSPAPTGGAVVTLTTVASQAGVVAVPASVTVPAGATKVSVQVATQTVTTPVFFHVTATYNTFQAKSDVIFVEPRIAYITYASSLSPGTGDYTSGANAPLTINLLTPAAAAMTFTLYCNNPDFGAPATVTIPAGAKAVSFVVKTPVAPQGASATVYGFGPNNLMVFGFLFLEP